MKRTSFFGDLFRRVHVSTRLGVALTAAFIGAVIVVNTVIFGFANKFDWLFFPEGKLEHEISDAASPYLSEIASRGDVRILFCDSPDALEADSVYNLVWQTARQYEEKYGFIHVENVNIYTHPELVRAYKYRENPETHEEEKINDINTASVIFRGPDDFAVLTMASFFVLDEDQTITAYSGEEVMAAMIRRVSTTERPKAYLTTSHGEIYATAFYQRLILAGYEPEITDLLTDDLTVGDGNLLVISNPQYDFVRGNPDKGIQAEVEKIEDFLASGGTVYALLDPLVTNTVNLEAMLSDWGITVMRAETENAKRDTVMIHDATDSITTDGYTVLTSFGEEGAGARMREEMDEIGAGRVVVSNASPLVLSDAEGKTVSPLLVTSSSSRAYAAGARVDATGSYPVAAMSVDGASGGGVFVVGSSFLAAENAVTTNEYGNKDMLLLLFRHLSGAAVPTGCTYLLFGETAIENLTMREARIFTVLVAALLPLAVAVTGVIVVRKRRER